MIGFKKHVLAQIECVLPVLEDAQQVIEDTLLPTGNEYVERLHIPLAGFTDQVGILNRPKDQFLAPFLLTQAALEKSARVLIIV